FEGRIHARTVSLCFSVTAPATCQLYPLSLHDALPISTRAVARAPRGRCRGAPPCPHRARGATTRSAHRAHAEARAPGAPGARARSEEHTSELQSLAYLVCRLLLEKKKKVTLSECRRRA